MRYLLAVLWLMLGALTPAVAQVSINFSSPGVSIGVNLPVYPQLVRVPDYPVYYAPSVNTNYFFFDGLYWVFDGDNWYASSWYNGPWALVDPIDVPLYVLRVPVRYYRRAPVYFRGWYPNDAPRWGDHWGHSWTQRRSGWDQWNRNAMPAPAPLPAYQRQYSGSRYPQPTQQAVIQTQNYRYQPRDAVAQQQFQHQRTQAQTVQQAAPAPQPRQTPAPRQQQSQQVAPQAAEQHRQAPAVRERETRAPTTPQRIERAERPPQPAPVVREQQAAKPPQPRAERAPPQAPVAHDQRAPRPQAQESAHPGNEQGKGHDNKGKDKQDKDEKEPKEKGRDR